MAISSSPRGPIGKEHAAEARRAASRAADLYRDVAEALDPEMRDGLTATARGSGCLMAWSGNPLELITPWTIPTAAVARLGLLPDPLAVQT